MPKKPNYQRLYRKHIKRMWLRNPYNPRRDMYRFRAAEMLDSLIRHRLRYQEYPNPMYHGNQPSFMVWRWHMMEAHNALHQSIFISAIG